MGAPMTTNSLNELKRENKLLRREVERLQARIEVSRLKELKLLSDLIELQREVDKPAE
jgi:hypothetical protein